MIIKAIREDGVKVEAVQFKITESVPCKYGVAKKYNTSELLKLIGETVHIPTLPDGTPSGRTCVELPCEDGVWFADVGDYVVKTEDGDLYPCSPNEWETDYEVISGSRGDINMKETQETALQSLSQYTDEKLLYELISRKQGIGSPHTRRYCVEHIDFTIGIGKDHHATITLDEEALEKVKQRFSKQHHPY